MENNVKEGIQIAKKVGKGIGIGFLGMLFLGTIISDSEKTGIIEQMEKELAEYSREVEALKTTNEHLEKDVSKKREEYEELEEIFEELEKQLAELEQAPVAVPAIDPVRDEPVEEEVVEEEVVEPTMEQKNAVRQAQQYLNIMAFSRTGLIKQLEYENYSTEDATYGVDNITVDWNEQALKKAKEYLNIMAFSQDGLKEQLKYEGFTQEQINYAIEQLY